MVKRCMATGLIMTFLSGCGVFSDPVPIYAPSPTFTELEKPNYSDVAIIHEGVQTHLWVGNSNVFEDEGEWRWIEYVERKKLVIDPDYRPPVPTQEKVPVEVRYTAKLVHFAFDSAALNANAKKIIDDLQFKDADQILLDGHTDAKGSDAYNLKLGERRALAVKKYLIKRGISESKFQLLSHGKREPVAPNETATGRQSNRRVVIRLNLRNSEAE